MLDRYDQDLLLDYLEGELDADRLAQFETLLEQDAQLAALMDAMASDRAALRTLPQAEAPADLTQEVTQSLERRMLLDEDMPASEPIPITRGRGLPGEETGGLRWGRIAGLSALAASVALAAGIVVITLDHNQDPLMRTAEKLATDGEDDAAEDAVGDEAPAIDPAGTPLDNAVGGGATADKAFADLESLTDPDAGDAAAPPAEALAALGAPGADATNSIPGFAERRGAARAVDLNTARQGPQPALALAITEPRRQLVLYSEKPEMTREQLVQFCIDNSIPIVQNGLTARPAAPPQPAIADRPDDAAEDVAAIDEYALLIDEVKLEELVNGMNGTIALSSTNFDARLAISNQAALVTELPGRRDRAVNLAQGPADPNTPDALEPDRKEEASDGDAPAPQPIELRLPEDLGSEFANERNRVNFNNEQQRAYSYGVDERPDPDPAQPAADDQPAEGAPAEPADRDDKDAQANELEEHDNANPDPKRAREPARFGAGQAPQAETDNESPQNPPAAADPSRGNWLAPHLPLANTTPILILNRPSPTKPPQLVPIVIQRAPSEQVNSLRLEQQTRYQRTAKPEQAGEAEPADKPADPAAEEPGDGDAEPEAAEETERD